MGFAGIDTLEQEKFSKSNLMHLNFEDIVKMSLAISIRVLLLEAHLSIIIELAGKEQVISWLDFYVVNWSKRVDESWLSILVLDCSSLFLTQGKHIDSVFWQNKEIICVEKETFNCGLPKLVALVPVFDQLVLKINHKDVECVDSNWFETNNNLA